MPNKPRSDSTLDSLNSEQKQLLREWLVDENVSYKDAKDRLWQDFHIRTSVSALSKFYATQCYALRSSQARDFAEEVVTQLTDGSEKYDEATLALIRQKAFERAYARDGNLADLALLVKMLTDTAKLELKKKDQQIAERRVKLLEQKAAQADAAKDVTADQALTPAEREAKLKEIFGLR
jgi:hypothetical protein